MKTVIAVLIGMFFIVASSGSFQGPGYFGDWSIVLGASIITVAATWVHGMSHATMLIPRKEKWKWVVYRTIYFALLAFLAFRQVSFEAILLGVNQAFLFGAAFDPIYNKYANKGFWYHGGESWYDDLVRKNPQLAFIIEVSVFIITAFIIAT